MEIGYSKVSWLFLLLLLVFAVTISISNRIIKPRENLKTELKSLFNGGGALSDFVFFDLEDLENYTETKGPPRNRTELRRKTKPRSKNRTLTEITLARALRNYNKNNNRELITSWATLLYNVLYSDVLNDRTKNVLKGKMIALSKKSTRLVARAIKREAQRKKTLNKQADISRLLHEYELKSDIKQQMFDSEEEDGVNEDENNDPEEIYSDTPINMDADFEDYLSQVLADRDNENQRAANKKKALEKYDSSLTSHADNPRRRGMMQTMDFKRMRRAASYSYIGTATCYDEGSEGSTSKTILLCKTCYQTVDFGSTVFSKMPQYANSIECDDSYSNCLGADGTCTQKVVYYTMQALTDATTNTWESFEQPLNISCECECIANSMTDVYMVGESN